MRRRIYRLGALLRHAGACGEWRAFVAQYDTADEVLDAINADPGRRLGTSATGVGWDVRYFAWGLAASAAESHWWEKRWSDYDGYEPSITPEERRRFLALWQRYADAHGLYEDVP